MKWIVSTSLVTLVLSCNVNSLLAQGTAFTYQGRLTVSGTNLTGTAEFQPTLWDALSGGAQVASNSPASVIVGVTNGLFLLPLDFSANFSGANRWLQLEVRTTMGPFAPLSPRQQVTPTPYAITAGSVPAGGGLAGVYSNAVTFSNAANGFSGNGAGLTGLNAGQLTSGTVPPAALANAWKTGGNPGTTPGAHFLGTTDYQPIEIKVNGLRALRLEPTIEDSFRSNVVNIIGGSPANSAGAGLYGATIAGGGSAYFWGFGPNKVTADFGTVSGGVGNEAAGSYSTIGGGAGNTASGRESVVGGGRVNSTTAIWSTIGGGLYNTILYAPDFGTDYAVIGGGSRNTNSGYRSTIAGGDDNFIADTFNATIGGGAGNSIQTHGGNSTISGGIVNAIERFASYTTIAGGYANLIGNAAQTATIAGGQENTNAASYATIGGGSVNLIQTNAQHGMIGGGRQNKIGIDSKNCTIAGGMLNGIANNSDDSTVGGGANNHVAAGSPFAIIAGGYLNDIGTNALYCSVGGGYDNNIGAISTYATIAGGVLNEIGTNGNFGTIGGGQSNNILNYSLFATIPGGKQNVAASYCFAAGNRAKATNQGSFVWGDSTEANVASTNANSVTMRASGGYRLFTDTNATTGAFLASGSGSWTTMSDRNAKEDFRATDGRAVLEKVVALAVQTWNYKSQDASVRHIGPMAQDFKAAFSVGESDIGISTVDADGVALAAIQGLNQKLEQKLEQKETEITELKQRLAALEKFVANLRTK